MYERTALSVTENGTFPPFRRCSRFALLALTTAVIGGCATTSNMTQFKQAQQGVPVKTLVMESPMAIDQSRLRAVLAPDIKAQSAAADELVARGERHAKAYALAAMESTLNQQPGFAAVTPPTPSNSVIDKIRAAGLADNMTQAEADQLHAATGADALLRFGITDYGLTPKTWRKGYITFEVTSTLAIAGIIAYTGSAAAKAAAGAYLAQETVEETAEGYAGFWALDTVYWPVRLEAELVRLHPVGIAWKISDTGFSDGRWSRLSGKVSADERNRQLDQATADAVKEVVADLSTALGKYQGKP